MTTYLKYLYNKIPLSNSTLSLPGGRIDVATDAAAALWLQWTKATWRRRMSGHIFTTPHTQQANRTIVAGKVIVTCYVLLTDQTYYALVG